jgi:hypothetical protein
MGEQTSLVKYANDKKSLRTSVPISIIKNWNLKAGDKIDWSWKSIKAKWWLGLPKHSKYIAN